MKTGSRLLLRDGQHGEGGRRHGGGDSATEAPGDETILGPVQDAPQLDDRDLVFVGMPIMRFGAPEAAQRYLEEQCAGRRVALFVTHTAPDYLEQLPGWLDACRAGRVRHRAGRLFHCQGVLAEPIRQLMLGSGDPMLAQFAEMAACADGQPDEAALARAAEFARETVARVEVDLVEQAEPVAV